MVIKILTCSLLLLPSAWADELQYLDHSELALSRMYNDISEAQDTIDLTYLTWDPCSSVSKVLMKKISEKARPKPTAENPDPKPVKVRMLIDSYFHRGDLGAMQRYFQAQGVDFKFFNPTISPEGGNYHSHSKLTLIDKKIPGKARMITGGRNISDSYFGMGKENYVDRDVSVIGPSSTEDRRGTVAQAQNGFEKLWKNHYASKVNRRASEESLAKIAACTKWNEKDRRLEKFLRANAKKKVASEKSVQCQNVRFTIDDMKHAGVRGAPLGDSNQIMPAVTSEIIAHKPTTLALLGFLKGSENTLTMENQYFIPAGPLKQVLQAKRGSGVKIQLYSNMFDGSDEKVVYWHTRYMKSENRGSQTNHSKFRVAGLLDKWEFTPPKATYSYHAKTFVADGRDAIVSSFNIDPRSMEINGESALIVKDCPVFARQVEQVAKMTGKMWTLEENLALCEGQERPRPPEITGFERFIQFITKDFQ